MTLKVSLFNQYESIKTTNSTPQLDNSEKAAKKLTEYFQNSSEENNFTISSNNKDIKAQLKKIRQQRAEIEKILNTKSSNGLTYIQAKEIIQKIQKKFQGDFRTWVLNEKRSKTTGTAHYDIDFNKMKNLMSPEDREAYENAEKACAELETKYPEIDDYYFSYEINSSIGNLELKDEYKK